MIAGVLGEIDDRWDEIFKASGQYLQGPAHRVVSQRHQWRALRHGAVGDGAVLLSAGPADFSRYRFFRQVETRFRGCTGSACKFTAAYIIAHEAGHHVQNLLGILPRVTRLQQQSGSKAECQRASGQGRTAGGLPVGRLGQPRVEEASQLPRTRRHRRGADDGICDRRRYAAAAGHGQGGAGFIHPRLRRAEKAMVHDRLSAGHGTGLQHVWRPERCRMAVPSTSRNNSCRSTSRC